MAEDDSGVTWRPPYAEEMRAEVSKIPAPLMALLREQAAERVRILRQMADSLEAADDVGLAMRGASLDPSVVDGSPVAKVCWKPLAEAASKHSDALTLHLHYHPSKQSWAWQVRRGQTEWYISTDQIADAFARLGPAMKDPP